MKRGERGGRGGGIDTAAVCDTAEAMVGGSTDGAGVCFVIEGLHVLVEISSQGDEWESRNSMLIMHK